MTDCICAHWKYYISVFCMNSCEPVCVHYFLALWLHSPGTIVIEAMGVWQMEQAEHIHPIIHLAESDKNCLNDEISECWLHINDTQHWYETKFV